jgi:hypothetical protein
MARVRVRVWAWRHEGNEGFVEESEGKYRYRATWQRQHGHLATMQFEERPWSEFVVCGRQVLAAGCGWVALTQATARLSLPVTADGPNWFQPHPVRRRERARCLCPSSTTTTTTTTTTTITTITPTTAAAAAAATSPLALGVTV